MFSNKSNIIFKDIIYNILNPKLYKKVKNLELTKLLNIRPKIEYMDSR